MASYFYLLSSLPMLKAEGDMPIKYEQFLDYCKGELSEAKYEMLKNLTLDSDKGPLISEWSKFYKAFKGELTYMRGKKFGNNPPQVYERDSEASKVIAMALADTNPLNAEKTLLELQFDKLDSLIGTHSFDDYSLFGYALKLKLLERKAVFSQKKGKSELSRLVKGLEEQIQSIN